MTWSHRICKKMHKCETHETVLYGVHEVYYNEKGEVWAATEDPMAISTAFIKDMEEFDDVGAIAALKEQLERILCALDAPILDLDTIVYAKDRSGPIVG